jgi:hypothetical protein
VLFSFYQFRYFYSLFCAFSPHYIVFYISFVFCQSVGRRLPCPRRPAGPRPLHWSPPPLPPLAVASPAPVGRRSLRSGLPRTTHESAASLHRPHISPPLSELPARDVGPADPLPPTPPPPEARRHRLPPALPSRRRPALFPSSGAAARIPAGWRRCARPKLGRWPGRLHSRSRVAAAHPAQPLSQPFLGGNR